MGNNTFQRYKQEVLTAYRCPVQLYSGICLLIKTGLKIVTETICDLVKIMSNLRINIFKFKHAYSA